MTAAPLMNPWSLAPRIRRRKAPLYLCVSGNSGSGKSTLVRSLTLALLNYDPHTIGIDERALHHPFLSSLFYEPSRFCYEVQINFMLQRVLVARTWLDLGYNVVMERSHLEDLVFVRHLRERGYLSSSEEDVYVRLWDQLRTRMPMPAVIVFLDTTPETSLRRITRDEDSGERPSEFPSEDAKERWVTSWAGLYRARFHELLADRAYSSHIVALGERVGTDEACQIVLSRISKKALKDNCL